MTRRRYLRHLTLGTSDQRDSYRDEVGDDVVAMLRPLLDRIVQGDRVAVPGQPGHTLHGAQGRRDRALVVTVSAPPLAGDHRHVPLVSIGVAPSSLASPEVWHAIAGCDRDDRTPSAPYCVHRTLPTLALDLRAATWIGDLGRCLAWTWVDG